MFLKTLNLHHFRNLERLDLTLHPQFNFVFGSNGQGKTNLLEALFYLSQHKSFRGAERAELIQQGQGFAKLGTVFERDGMQGSIDITLTRESRQILINQKKPQLRRDALGLLPMVLFEPRHIYLFRDSPSARRRYLNRALFLLDPEVLTLLTDYDKVIAQKNRLLKERPDPELLAAWNERLADLGAAIILKRQAWFADIAELLAAEYEAIARTGEDLRLCYEVCQGVLAGPEDLNVAAVVDRLRGRLAQMGAEEVRRRESLVGPHRDDFRALLNDRSIADFGSQGEHRSALIALKLAQLKLFARHYGKTPIFLLDDVASELDEMRCHHLFAYLRDTTTQVFLTTPSNRLKTPDFQGNSSAFLVERGGLKMLA
jgi:DNA replication and repair protein RecF